ncbi:MAG: DUF2851 family protein [Bacteroidetes bacterium]|jgi:hypothetical protein|nr:DUF2851 family protein [Bacteroidota bacterium]
MKEDFLHYLWKVGKFDADHLITTTGAQLQILRPGTHNHNAGPDFLNAKIKLDGACWEGHVEIHLMASDWIAHQHQDDPAYNAVILHVVIESDRPVFMENGQPMPTLELKNRIPAGVLGRYKQLSHTLSEIPCENFLDRLQAIQINPWLERLAAQRLERKSTEIIKIYRQFDGDGEQTLFYLWCKYMGGKVNSEAYEELARRVNVRFLWKKRAFLQQIESYLLGLAGLIPDKTHEVYPDLLRREFEFLKRTYPLRPMNGVQWRFFRMRPSNFPTVRIAQLSMIYHKLGRWLPWILKAPIKELRQALCITPSNYWSQHYLFDKKTRRAQTAVGEQQFQKLVINVVIPFRVAWFKIHPNTLHTENPLDLLNEMPAENNKIIRLWKEKGILADNALQSQALIELKTKGCDERRCMSCAFGNYFLSTRQQPDVVEESFVTLQPIQ